MNNMNEDKVQKDFTHLVQKTKNEDALKLSKARNKALNQPQFDWSYSWLKRIAASAFLFVAVITLNNQLLEPIEAIDGDVEIVLADMEQNYELYDDFYYWLDIYDNELAIVD